MLDYWINWKRNRTRAEASVQQSSDPSIHPSSGFTLVELLVVLAIIIVVTSISIPTIAAMTSPKHALRKEGRKIMKLMTEARTAAMSRKVQIDLRIDPETREVRMMEARAFRSQMIQDTGFQSLETDTNRYETVIVFDEEYGIEAFTADEIQTGTEDDDGFQTLEVPMIGSEGAADQLAVSFTHFGGSSGGGITLVNDDVRLHLAADILTGRPKVVLVGEGEE